MKRFKNLALWGLLTIGLANAAPFGAASASAVYYASTGMVNFSITFNQTPDFYTVDQYGRTAKNFQIYVIGNAANQYPANYASIIRGEEIRFGNGIPVRAALPQSSDPNADGWGDTLYTAAFTLTDVQLTFSVPLADLTTDSTNGIFSYFFQAAVYGSQSQYISLVSSAAPTPEPSAYLGLTIAGATLLFIKALPRKQKA